MNKTNISRYPELENSLTKQLEKHNKDKSEEEMAVIDSALTMGFYSGLLITKVLEEFKDNLSALNRETFVNKFYEKQNFDVGGLNMGPFIVNKNNEGLKYAQLSKLQPDYSLKIIDLIFF